MSNGPYAIARDEEQGTVFIENACPGDVVEAEIYDQRKDFAFATLINVDENSSLRDLDPPCKLHKICGSCQWQHITYAEQLNFKRTNLIELLRQNKIEFDYDSIPNLIGMDNPWNYRNKIIYPVDIVKKTGRMLAGYFKRNSNELINIKHCPIQYSIFDAIMTKTKDLTSEKNLDRGVLRHVLMRSNIDFSEILICFIVRKSKLDPHNYDAMVEILTELREDFPEIKTTTLNYNDLSTNVILGDYTKTIRGDGYITETFGDIKLKISTTSFFQVNSSQFLKIIDIIKSKLNRQGEAIKLLDAYCGIGTISLSLAKAFPELHITGIELVESAIVDAKRNAKINQITQAEFIVGKVEDQIDNLLDQKFDAVIINPPRKGCTNKVLDALGKIASPQIIYVSCNPATLSRDIKHLEQYGYKLEFIQSIDMFPHSFHFETVAILVAS